MLEFFNEVEEEVEPDEHGGVQGVALEHPDVDLVEFRFMEQARVRNEPGSVACRRRNPLRIWPAGIPFPKRSQRVIEEEEDGCQCQEEDIFRDQAQAEDA